MTHNDTPECSHGTCGAERECTGPCKLRMLSLPVIEPRFLDEQLGLPVQMIEPQSTMDYLDEQLYGSPPSVLPDYPFDDFMTNARGWLGWARLVGLAIGGGLLLALIIYTTTK